MPSLRARTRQRPESGVAPPEWAGRATLGDTFSHAVSKHDSVLIAPIRKNDVLSRVHDITMHCPSVYSYLWSTHLLICLSIYILSLIQPPS
jgi:hypothetical protein